MQILTMQLLYGIWYVVTGVDLLHGNHDFTETHAIVCMSHRLDQVMYRLINKPPLCSYQYIILVISVNYHRLLTFLWIADVDSIDRSDFIPAYSETFSGCLV